jgi:hypothetical protein
MAFYPEKQGKKQPFFYVLVSYNYFPGETEGKEKPYCQYFKCGMGTLKSKKKQVSGAFLTLLKYVNIYNGLFLKKRVYEKNIDCYIKLTFCKNFLFPYIPYIYCLPL